MSLKEFNSQLDTLISNAQKIEEGFQYGNEREVSSVFFKISTLIEILASKMEN